MAIGTFLLGAILGIVVGFFIGRADRKWEKERQLENSPKSVGGINSGKTSATPPGLERSKLDYRRPVKAEFGPELYTEKAPEQPTKPSRDNGIYPVPRGVTSFGESTKPKRPFTPDDFEKGPEES
ncbi:hypothetical protein C5B42_03445 [Candidatus Cerribacteria bacterium 'Amazon FNV 2010 28 9']|uniref:Uncharacterized protein n=1 Tax=Candidatus Cerribacteria bacterium 'Amazon FNV 2010 28 9' TaxID=2081795 RepID=A0A317JPP3_9BACT|nr:MAG: hypothetical protein C5B42_03445 [Candidatus Cerribacteria bacterium 'Amazon FNV 2010 28 9']